MNNLKTMLSSKDMDWETPQDFFDELDKEFHFTLDPCATKKNAKCKKFFTKKEDGLKQDWSGETVFCNPPYGKEIKHWVRKAAIQSNHLNTLVVMLIQLHFQV
jgi:site-specific DNA-methyltransferase (adenine-specific)